VCSSDLDEALRVLDALIHVETKGEVCPANWEKGKEAMSANPKGVAEYLSKN
jgi:peroxiredoxin (alkyl hydroperoxide reductase subunit C)